MDKLPNGVLDIIYKLKHQLEFKDVMKQVENMHEDVVLKSHFQRLCATPDTTDYNVYSIDANVFVYNSSDLAKYVFKSQLSCYNTPMCCWLLMIISGIDDDRKDHIRFDRRFHHILEPIKRNMFAVFC